MSLNVGVGFSDGNDSYAVGTNACQDALRKMDGCNPVFGFVFTSSVYDHKKVIEGIRSVLKITPLLGASSAGEIVHGNVINKNSVIIVLFGGKEIFFSSFLKKLDPSLSLEITGEEIGKSLVKEIGIKPDISFMFTDVLSGIEQHKLVNSILKSTGSTVFGGASADCFEFKETYQYFKDEVFSGSAVFGSIKGDFRFGVGMDHGMLPAGMPRKVTRAEGVNVYKIDGKPAVTLYGEYFGYKDLQHFTVEPIGGLSLSYPMGFRWNISDEKIIVRAPLFLKSDGSLVCTDSIPEGSNLQIMIGDREEALRSVRTALGKAQETLAGEDPSLAVLISSAGRKYSYGSNIDDEVREVEKVLGNKVPVVGFYGYGGICAVDKRKDDLSVFQDNAVTICLLK